MQDRTKISALLNIRKDVIRGDMPGLAAVDALLRHYGANPGNQVIRPPRKPDAARHNAMRWMIREALRGGPMRTCDIAAHVRQRRPYLTYPETAHRTGQALQKMRRKGMVEQVRHGAWGLATGWQ